ncbi:hypothetical protein LB505_012446 [Fusarium chuoi]|nr:hypothetical protein LB505_012446 [Fusarium chuoi]
MASSNKGSFLSKKRAPNNATSLISAVRTLLECIGKDPGRNGLLDTPSRYAKALLFFTKGYHANIEDIINNALFHKCHKEMVIMRDIDIYSLYKHHLVPFTGKESFLLPQYVLHTGLWDMPANSLF